MGEILNIFVEKKTTGTMPVVMAIYLILCGGET